MRSLRSRLLAYGFGVAGAAIAVLALVLARGARQEVKQFVLAETLVEHGEPPRADDLVARLERHLLQGGRLADAGAILRPLAAGRRALVLDDSLRVVAAEPPTREPPRITRLADGVLRVESDDGGISQVELLRAPLAAIHAADGSRAGNLLLLPGPALPTSPEKAEQFMGSMERRLLVAAACAAAVALILGLLLARRISRPIEALTRAAGRLREGHHSERVATAAPGEVAELARAFNALAGDLERTEALRRRLVADVAHELRTPLTRLRGQVEALRDGLLPLDPATVESLYEESVLLSRLVEDVQQLALADARRLPLRPTRVDATELVRRAAAAAAAQAQGAGVELVVDGPSPCELDADADRLAQVLGNLIANSIAHTPRGGRVGVSVRALENESVEITVADNGEGIAPDHLPHVFERFYRADDARARRLGGSGLGLAIVREIAEAHGGEAGITSAVGQGTTVRIALPTHGTCTAAPNSLAALTRS